VDSFSTPLNHAAGKLLLGRCDAFLKESEAYGKNGPKYPQRSLPSRKEKSLRLRLSSNLAHLTEDSTAGNDGGE
jgi:hypothetical protein